MSAVVYIFCWEPYRLNFPSLSYIFPFCKRSNLKLPAFGRRKPNLSIQWTTNCIFSNQFFVFYWRHIKTLYFSPSFFKSLPICLIFCYNVFLFLLVHQDCLLKFSFFASFYNFLLCFCQKKYPTFLLLSNKTSYFPGHNILHMDFHFDDHWVYWVDFEEGKHNGVYRIHPDGTERQHVIMVSLSGTSGCGSGSVKKSWFGSLV